MAEVLLVEDDEALSQTLAQVLRHEGHVVDIEADGAAGLERARGKKHDLVILGLERSDLDSVDLCQRMRQDGVRVPVLILTERADESDIVGGWTPGRMRM